MRKNQDWTDPNSKPHATDQQGTPLVRRLVQRISEDNWKLRKRGLRLKSQTGPVDNDQLEALGFDCPTELKHRFHAVAVGSVEAGQRKGTDQAAVNLGSDGQETVSGVRQEVEVEASCEGQFRQSGEVRGQGLGLKRAANKFEGVAIDCLD